MVLPEKHDLSKGLPPLTESYFVDEEEVKPEKVDLLS